MPVVEANSKSAGLFGVRRGGGSDVHRRGETRRHLSTGQRAMASALVLADLVMMELRPAIATDDTLTGDQVEAIE